MSGGTLFEVHVVVLVRADSYPEALEKVTRAMKTEVSIDDCHDFYIDDDSAIPPATGAERPWAPTP